MFKLYQNESLTFPNGKVFDQKQLSESDNYRIITSVKCLVDTDDDGITWAYQTLSYMKEAYNVSEEDDNEAVRLINEAIAKEKEQALQDAIVLEDVAAQTNENSLAIAELGVVTTSNADENAQALGELGVLIAEGQTSDADMLQAIGELGVQIAELSAKVDALSTPSA